MKLFVDSNLFEGNINSYKPKYSSQRNLIGETDFLIKIEKLIQSSLKKNIHKNPILNNEHDLIKYLTNKEYKNWYNIQRINTEINNLLFYHWYERKYKVNVINSSVLINLCLSEILSWFQTFSKDEILLVIRDLLTHNFSSIKFPEYSIFYESYYDFFPHIEKFDFSDLRTIKFFNYLIDLFPKIVQIQYLNTYNFWRITEEELNIIGCDHHSMILDRSYSHNGVYINKYKIPCFYPSKIGQKNYDLNYVDDVGLYTPMFKHVKQRTRIIENILRQERGIPKIGEGWVSETKLYYYVKEEFKKTKVIHHGRPDWLKPQHLDIYIPEYNIGIEYQGIQHQKPIDFFGGEQSFKKGVERDERKKRLCEENECELIYVYPDYNRKTVLNNLKEKLIKKNYKV